MVLTVLRGDGLAGVGPATVGKLRRLAEDVGATFHTVVGDDVPTALLDFARGANATQLVLGTSRRSRVARLFDEGIGASVIQASGPIDVHMVTHAEANPGWRRGLHLVVPPVLAGRGGAGARLTGWALAVLLPALMTVAGVLLRDHLSLSTDVVGYFLVTVVVGLLGLGPALLTAFLSAGLVDFFFTPPYHTLLVADQENTIALVAMVLVAVVVAVVVGRAAHRAEQAAHARTEAALLASYARTVLTHDQPLTRLLEKVRENFSLTSVALVERQDGTWRQIACAGPAGCTDPDEADVDVPVIPDVHLALRGRTLPAADRRVLEAAAGQALLTLRQQRAAAEAHDARRRAETTQLRTALLSAVGHDLRTPLTSIKAAIGSLRAPDLELSAADERELLATVEESSDQLAGLVDNLLDSSRLATGAVEPQLRPVTYDEVVARALASLDTRARPVTDVTVDVGEQLPAVVADPGLLERVVANVVDNAVRHGVPPRGVAGHCDGRGTQDEPAIAIRASTHADRVELRVVDHGKGLPKRGAESVFTPFQRLGDRDTSNGLGLGLSVAKGFTDAMGGTIRAEDTPGGGLTVVISLPAAN
jgi:two-component system sensor histidine kinase KdpD